MKKQKKPISKKTFYFLISIGSILYIFTFLIVISLINPTRHIFAIDILKVISGFILGTIATIFGIVMGGRIADDYQIGMNYKPGLGEENEE